MIGCLTVSEVTRYIKALLDGQDALQNLEVEGEISNCRQAASGHCYFTLKDSECEIKCVMWRSVAARMRLPEQGAHVRAHGYVSVFERSGAYQLYVDELDVLGDGDLWQRFLELRERLRGEGLFDRPRRPLPRWPKRIGIVTSSTGAALQDILNVLGRRYPLVEVLVADCRVQGTTAPKSILQALRRVQQDTDVDLIIVARGGGSIEDLWAFNDETLAREVAAARVPVISGVGHETDFTVIDFVSDVRAPTPSAAAVMAVPDIEEVAAQIDGLTERLCAMMEVRLSTGREHLALQQRLLLRHAPERRLSEYAQRVDLLARRLDGALAHRLQMERTRLSGEAARLRGLDPRAILGRGYAVVRDQETGVVLSDARQTAVDRAIDIVLHDGHLGARVTHVSGEDVGL